MANNITEAYSVQVKISEGVAEILYENATTAMSAIVYGFSEYSGYGYPVGNYRNKGKFCEICGCTYRAYILDM